MTVEVFLVEEGMLHVGFCVTTDVFLVDESQVISASFILKNLMEAGRIVYSVAF